MGKKARKSGWLTYNKKRSEERKRKREGKSKDVDDPNAVESIIGAGKAQASVGGAASSAGDVVASPVGIAAPERAAESPIEGGAAGVASPSSDAVASPTESPNKVGAVGAPSPIEDVAASPIGIVVAERSFADVGVQCCLPSVPQQDAGVGEHLSGEPFVWQGIFDMP